MKIEFTIKFIRECEDAKIFYPQGKDFSDAHENLIAEMCHGHYNLEMIIDGKKQVKVKV